MREYMRKIALLIAGVALSLAFAVSAQAGILSGGGYMAIAKQYNGTNPTGWSRNWCGQYIDVVMRKAGKAPYGAKAYNPRYGRKTGCRVGAIAMMQTHVGLVTSCNKGTTTIISGNHAGKPGNRVVGYGTYRNSRILAFRMP
jgi:hypothetical protein